ncbi:unnamed protein product [Adineta steineri]|uniref:G-protein coupled receptors family 3 profile domain-containing protein n=1 Tax=Adineta steineri TaxID=433720 RepID=A0A813ZI50_9BILA|nr:unnamed protein product [Adineta steineri]CAF3815534.1 unnamed protein product [Adineta steineri]
MGTKSFRLFVCVIMLFSPILANDYRQRIVLNNLFTNTNYPSIQIALEQVNTQLLSQIDRQFYFNETEGMIECDVGIGIKTFFDMLNQSPSLNVLFTDACQNVLTYISETATYFKLPIISFTDSDLSLLTKDRYPYFYHIVPSDHSHNRVRTQLLHYFNWTRFGLIYQHGSKYTLVANDLSNLVAMDKIQFEVNLTRGLAYRHGPEWEKDNAGYMKGLLTDFKTRDVRIIIANFNQTIATQMFCHAAREHIYGSRYQWIILGFPSLSDWWYEPTNCSKQELIRAINGTLQTRVPRFSIDTNQNRSDNVLEYLKIYSEMNKTYFDAYAYDTIWSLAYLYQIQSLHNQSNIEIFKKHLETIDFIGATGRVRYLNGGRIGEILVEQFVACRMMTDGTCISPCYEEEDDCNLTVVKVFLAKNSESKIDPPILYKLNPIMWHGNGPPRDRTNQTIEFQHIYISVFISISICSGIGLFISCTFLAFNIHFQSHRFIRMSSPALNNLILCGCMLAYMSIIVMGINSSLFIKKSYREIIMNIICPIRVWILCISFTLAFGSMFSKTWRVHSIFTNINTTKKGIHDSRLLAIVGILLFVDLIFLISWQIFDPIHQKRVYDTPSRLKDNHDIEIIPYREECKSKNMSLWVVILIIYKGLLMFFGSFLSWKTRHVTIPALNDSRYIGLSVYIVFICCTLGSLVIFIPNEQIQFSYFLRSFFIVICTTATVCLVFVPKIIEVYRDPHSRKRQPRVTSRFLERNHHRAAVTIQNYNTALEDNQHLKFVLSMQEETVDRLLKELTNLQTGKNNPSNVGTLELERLVAPNDETEETHDDDPLLEGDDETSITSMRNHTVSRPECIARAVSLCLLNKIQMKQLYWPDSVGIGRYSIPSFNDRLHPSSTPSPSKILFQQTHENSKDKNKENSKLIEIVEDTELSSNNLKRLYDGLGSLDEIRLNEMIETDLIS